MRDEIYINGNAVDRVIEIFPYEGDAQVVVRLVPNRPDRLEPGTSFDCTRRAIWLDIDDPKAFARLVRVCIFEAAKKYEWAFYDEVEVPWITRYSDPPESILADPSPGQDPFALQMPQVDWDRIVQYQRDNINAMMSGEDPPDLWSSFDRWRERYGTECEELYRDAAWEYALENDDWGPMNRLDDDDEYFVEPQVVEPARDSIPEDPDAIIDWDNPYGKDNWFPPRWGPGWQ